MRKTILTLFIAALFSATAVSVTAASDTIFSFRGNAWGASVEQVQKNEDAKRIETKEDFLKYTDNLDGKKVTVAYFFDDGKLWRGAYLLNEKYSNDNKYVDSYFELVSLLKEKYGKPDKQTTYWSKDDYKGRHEKRGIAHSIGEACTVTVWNNVDGTEIRAEIGGNNFKITVTIAYTSINLGAKALTKEKEKEKSKI